MDNLISENLGEKKRVATLILLIPLIFGLAFRLFHYFYNRSLWMDEVYLSSSLIRMNYSDLATEVLDYQQKAPIGFLWMVKFVVNLFGNNEMILRLIPLICSFISLFLYIKVCRYFLRPWGQMLAICIFSFAPALVYHSVEIKQYATECLATIIALYLYIKYNDKNSWGKKLIWGVFGGIILWFSFSVIFILTGIATGLTLNSIANRDWKSAVNNAVPFGMWMISFLVNYLLFTHKHADSEWIVYWFKTYDNFMPFPPSSLQQLKWYPSNFLQMMDYPLGLVWNFKYLSGNILIKLLAIPILSIVLLVTGIISLSKRHRRDFYILFFPILFMLLASGCYLYPLLERFWVFIAPVFILFIAIGFDYYLVKIKHKIITWILFLLTVIGPFIQSAYFMVHPEKFYKHKKSFVKESFTYIDHHFQDGDAVYNYWNNSPGYAVYRKMYHFKYRAIVGYDFRKASDHLSDYNLKLQSDFKNFSSKKRVWLVFNNQFLTNIGDLVDTPKWYYKNELTPNENLIREFNKQGRFLKKLVYSDVTVYLLELKHIP